MMRVGILTTSFPLTKNSTSGPFVLRLINQLPNNVVATVLAPGATKKIRNPPLNQQHELRCFRYAPTRWQLIAHQPGGMPVALRNDPRLYLLLPIFFASMFASCIKLGREVELIHANWSLNGVVAGFAGLLTKTKVLTTLHGSDVADLRSSHVKRLSLRLCLKLSQRVIAVSKTIYQDVIDFFPGCAYKLVMIPNGVPTTALESQNLVTVPGKPLQITHVGNLIPLKGVNLILEALKVAALECNFKLQIIGDGPEASALRSLAKALDLEEIVDFKGPVPPTSVHSILLDTDIFVLASFSEGRPNALLEAMAAGVSVVASSIDSVQEIVKDDVTGLLFQSGNAQHLATQIIRLGKDAELRGKLGRAGRNYISSQGFTWDQIAHQHVQLYKAVVNT